MNEDKVTFLIKAASFLSQSQNDQTKTLLRSYYLMRCRELSKNHGLPDRHFSSKVRCSRCFLEWKKGTETTVRSIKLSKGQKRRIKQLKGNKNHKEEYVKARQQMLNSNELKQICTFCKYSTITPILKPTKPKVIPIKGAKIAEERIKDKIQPNTKTTKTNKPNNQLKKVEVDVCAKTKDIFTLTNKNNTLQRSVKEQKVIKNNKKKKDKFAGLCQQAVLMSAKLKQEKEKQNKLNLFLKPLS